MKKPVDFFLKILMVFIKYLLSSHCFKCFPRISTYNHHDFMNQFLGKPRV